MIYAIAKIVAGVVAVIWFRRPPPAVDGTPTDTVAPTPPTVADPVIPNPTEVSTGPRTPGDSYDNPAQSNTLKPGFRGFIQVQSGDSLIGIVRRLGRSDSEWSRFVNMLENQWAVALCTAAVRAKYYGGNKGITLTRQYGTQPGKDCVAKGYGPGFPLLSTSTGSFPVIFWDGE